MNVHTNNFRDLAAAEFDTTTLLAHAAEQAIERRYEDFCIVDVDCHHYETEAFNEILQYMEHPTLFVTDSPSLNFLNISRPVGYSFP